MSNICICCQLTCLRRACNERWNGASHKATRCGKHTSPPSPALKVWRCGSSSSRCSRSLAPCKFSWARSQCNIYSALSPLKVSHIDYLYSISLIVAVTALTSRLFACWALVASAVGFNTAIDVNNRAMYRLTLFTFYVALGLYGFETCVTKTMPFFPSLLPVIILAGVCISILWMTFGHSTDKQ